MSKQDLDGTEIRSSIQQMGGERVPPNVRAHLLLDADLYGELLAHLPDSGWMDPGFRRDDGKKVKRKC